MEEMGWGKAEAAGEGLYPPVLVVKPPLRDCIQIYLPLPCHAVSEHTHSAAASSRIAYQPTTGSGDIK